MEDAFLLGPALLVAPVLAAGATTRAVHLPQGSQWCGSGPLFAAGFLSI